MPATIQSIKSLLETDKLVIPNYQRPYKWTKKNIEDLLTDISNAIADARKYKDFKYRIGTVLLHDNKNTFEIVDGQQRTISLYLIYSFLKPGYKCFFSDNAKFSNTISQKNIKDNAAFIRQWFSSKEQDEKVEFAEAFEKTLEVVVITVAKTSEAFQLFDSQNTRGKALNPHDLLKAYHLREMTDDLYEMEHAVDAWENKDPKNISELFDTYLFPIINWADSKPTDTFTAQHIDVFKGIEESSNYSYARRAVKSSPVFQITEPFTAGSDFFQYVDHYMSLRDDIVREINRNEIFRDVNDIIKNPKYTRYTGFWYSINLFHCSLLCYFDRFHSFDKAAVIRLFTWSMMIRVDMDHLSFSTINKYAIGDNSNNNYSNSIAMFSSIVHARKHTDISSLTVNFRDEFKGVWNGLLIDLKKLNGLV